MIKFKKQASKIILQYEPISSRYEWIYSLFADKEPLVISRTFTLDRSLLLTDRELLKREKYNDPIEFLFAERQDTYFKVAKGILSSKIDIFLHEKITVQPNLFACNKASIIKKLERYIDEDLIIGGENATALPYDLYRKMISELPRKYELDLYNEARISSVLKGYFDTAIDAEQKLQNYLNKKTTKTAQPLIKNLAEYEIEKYELVLERLNRLLNEEWVYPEKDWQEAILEIILLLFPKYLYAFREAPILTNSSSKAVDFILIDSDGNIDLIEIKKPFKNSIVSHRTYRDNHIPLKELSGSIMQLEKYIYYLTGNLNKNAQKIHEKFKDKLPWEFLIQITNPRGIVIIGRENNLSQAQKLDFEVIKRKYKNIVDIITYDNLLHRLQNIITKFRKTAS